MNVDLQELKGELIRLREVLADIVGNGLVETLKCKRCGGTGRTDDGPYGPTTNLGSVFPGTFKERAHAVDKDLKTSRQQDPWCPACNGRGH